MPKGFDVHETDSVQFSILRFLHCRLLATDLTTSMVELSDGVYLDVDSVVSNLVYCLNDHGLVRLCRISLVTFLLGLCQYSYYQ